MCLCHGGSVVASLPRDAEFLFGVLSEYGEVRSLAECVPEYAISAVRHLDHLYAQVTVPEGHQAAIADEVQTRFLLDLVSHNPPTEVANTLLHRERRPLVATEFVAEPGANGAFDPNQPLQFSPAFGADFDQSLGTRPAPGRGARVAIIDSGVSTNITMANGTSLALNVVQQSDITTHPVGSTAIDHSGHGSLIAAIVNHYVTGLEIESVKVYDSDVVREWNFLAGLTTAFATNPDVVNASIGFGLNDASCVLCNRNDRGTVRSLVFARLLNNLQRNHASTVFVAAGGNDQQPPAYPAAFRDVVCALSTTPDANQGAPPLSTRSNIAPVRDERGNVVTDGPLIVAAPGGEPQHQGPGVASYGGRHWWGTSLSAAYVTAVIAADAGANGQQPATVRLQRLRNALDPAPSQSYGAGILRWIP